MDNLLGVILAGGQSLRMGGVDKSTAILGEKRLVDHVLARLSGQVGRVIISGSDDYGLPLATAPDALPGQGPLAGLHGAMVWALENAPQTLGLLCAPVDAPYLPLDLAARLVGAGPAIAETRAGLQPTFGFWPLSLYEQLDAHLRTDEGGALRYFARKTGARHVVFDDERAFLNINAPDDLMRAQGEAS